jgi:hypothetical protein
MTFKALLAAKTGEAISTTMVHRQNGQLGSHPHQPARPRPSPWCLWTIGA